MTIIISYISAAFMLLLQPEHFECFLLLIKCIGANECIKRKISVLKSDRIFKADKPDKQHANECAWKYKQVG